MKILVAIALLFLSMQCVDGGVAVTAAFSVRRIQSFWSPLGGSLLHPAHRIPYNSILRNDHNAYNVVSREYKVPVTGVYNFQFSAAAQTVIMTLRLRSVWGGWLASAESRDFGTQASNSVVVELKRGDRVSVYLYNNHRTKAAFPASCVFSGFLLYPTLF